MGLRVKISLVVVIVLFVIAGLIGFVLLFDYMGTRSSTRLNALLEEIEIGLPLSEAPEKLGEPSRVLTKANDIESWGTIKDKKVIEKCDLYMYPYWGLPHKYILIYVDKDLGTVKYVKVKPM